jgi:hypothetical protein
MHASSVIRTHDPSVRADENDSCHCDRPSWNSDYCELSLQFDTHTHIILVRVNR